METKEKYHIKVRELRREIYYADSSRLTEDLREMCRDETMEGRTLDVHDGRVYRVKKIINGEAVDQALCPCGCVEPAGYHNYGPEDGWPHCPDCGYV